MEYKNKRVGGLVTLVLGAVLGKFFIYDTLQAAKEGQAEITIYRSAIVASIMCVLLGLLYIALGDKADGILKFDPKNLTVKNVVILVTLAGAGLAVFIWVNMQLSDIGYK